MGLGYIGLPTAIIAAKHGVQVTGVDINPKVVEMTNQGHLHIVEPGMEEMLQDVVRSGALHASTTPEFRDAKVAINSHIARRSSRFIYILLAFVYTSFIETMQAINIKIPFKKRYPNMCSGHISIEPSESRRCIAPPRQ